MRGRRVVRKNIVWNGALLWAMWTGVAPAAAQSLGTFRWQLQPYCNVLTLAITQSGAGYRVEGSDDQCGAGADSASAIGTAFVNADGTIGFGVAIVTTPGGAPVHVDATVPSGGVTGTWRDSLGHSGAFSFTPGASTGGATRPLPAPTVPGSIHLQPDGGLVAMGTPGAAIPATGTGTRLMWHSGKAALRAGRTSGTEWDDSMVGRYSTALGDSNAADGVSSTALGMFTRASGQVSVAMGDRSVAGGFASIAAGELTAASGTSSVALGLRTAANGDYAVAAGTDAVASGRGSVAVGNNVIAGGAGSMVLGSHMETVASSQGTFMFGDASTTLFTKSQLPNQFIVRAVGGVSFRSSDRGGVVLLPGASAWSSTSDVHTKENFRALTSDDVLARIARMPVREWNYKWQDQAIRHMGPTAQDFHAAFGLGEDPLRISTIDADGVALAGVQALDARGRAVETRHDSDLAALRAEIAALQGRVLDLERRRHSK